MTKVSKLALFFVMAASSAAYAQAPGETEVVDQDQPQPQEQPQPQPQTYVRKPIHDPLATDRVWGFGVRATGLSGIGALPGVNYGGEMAANIRHQELFAELAVARWKPEHTYVVTESPDHVELGLNCWTARAGWAGMKMPLRAWVLGEVGELASAKQMPGVLPRAMMGSTPMDHRWKAVGAGFGVAWPMTDTARLFGMVEFAVPVNRSDLQLDQYGTYQPDPLAARSSVGLEFGWR